MKIYRLKKDLVINTVGVHSFYKKGARFFKPSDKSMFKTIGADFYPDKGNIPYPIAERENFKFVDEYLELIGESDKTLEYYTEKRYTAEEIDKMLNSTE